MKKILAGICGMAAAISAASAGDEGFKPEIFKWGVKAADLEAALEGKCAGGFEIRPIDPPFLPTKPEKQLQIDCDGFDFLGAPRWTEFVIGDDRLQMVWVMVDDSDKAKAIEALKDAYGEPSHETPMFVAFTQGRAAWREEPAEILFYSEELDAPMKGWFDSAQ